MAQLIIYLRDPADLCFLPVHVNMANKAKLHKRRE